MKIKKVPSIFKANLITFAESKMKQPMQLQKSA